MCYINSRVFKSEDFKYEVIFAFRIHSDPPMERQRGIIGGRKKKADKFAPQKRRYIKYRVLSGKFCIKLFNMKKIFELDTHKFKTMPIRGN